MDWTLKDSMVDGLFICATLTGCRGGLTSFVQTRAETPDTRAKAVKSDPGSSWEERSGGMGADVGDENVEYCRLDSPLHIPLVIRSGRCTYVIVRGTDELLCGGYKWVSRFEAPCICTRWNGEYFDTVSQYVIIYWNLLNFVLKSVAIMQTNLCSADFEMLF